MIFEMVEITEASEGTDHHGGTEKRRMSLRVSAVNRFLRTLR